MEETTAVIAGRKGETSFFFAHFLKSDVQFQLASCFFVLIFGHANIICEQDYAYEQNYAYVSCDLYNINLFCAIFSFNRYTYIFDHFLHLSFVQELRTQLIAHNGSVQQLPLPADMKALIVWHVPREESRKG